MMEQLGKAVIYTGDALAILKTIPGESVHCCVTSPPYWGLRDYGTAKWEGGDLGCDHKGAPLCSDKSGLAGYTSENIKLRTFSQPYKDICGKCGAKRIDNQIGLEKTPEEYVSKMVEIFREVKRVLRNDGTVFLNLGDSYGSGTRKTNHAQSVANGDERDLPCIERGKQGYAKQLIGIPWRVAFALQADGWYLRQDIIWNKPNPMPESVTDRCTKSHEYVFLMTKSAKYYFDNGAIKERAIYALTSGDNRPPGIVRDRLYGYDSKESVLRGRTITETENGITIRHPLGKHARGQQSPKAIVDYRNKRSVWTVNTKPYPDAHFATYPPKLIEPMILAGCPVDGTVLDPFAGSGTTGEVALRHSRRSILIELNPKYIELIKQRLAPVIELARQEELAII
jgi:DNA modification methylase